MQPTAVTSPRVMQSEGNPRRVSQQGRASVRTDAESGKQLYFSASCRGGEILSEKEKDMLERWAKLPPGLQDRFLDRLQGAADAVDVLAATQTPTGADPRTEA